MGIEETVVVAALVAKRVFIDSAFATTPPNSRILLRLFVVFVGNRRENLRLLQIFIEPRDGAIKPVNLILGLQIHVAFTGVDDKFCRDAKRL